MPDYSLPSLEDFAEAEHCILEDVTVQQPALSNSLEGGREPARKLWKERRVVDKLRKRQITLRLYAEGWADLELERRGREPVSQRIDLRYIDPVPTMSRYRPVRLFKTAAVLGGIAGIGAIPALFGWFLLYAIPTAVVASVAALTTLFVAWYRSHEKIVFKTLHGRADAIRLWAGLGNLKRTKRLLPDIVTAVAKAAESIHDETAVYLRAEMREHYRLRTAGVLSTEECAASTGRILSKFDSPS
jgi:hypothetical protein